VGLAVGFGFGMLRLLLLVLHERAGIVWPGPLQAFVDINWLYFSFLLFVFTCVLIFAVSAVTPQASPEQLAGLTYGSVTKEQNAATRASFGFWEIFHTGVILAIIAGIYIYFW
jgi:SSS family solute:Na+ symporter